MSRQPKHICIKETGVVYKLEAMLPPKKFLRRGEYVYRLAEEKRDPWTSGPKKVTPKERMEMEKQKKKKPSKWKIKMLELMGFPPEKIKEMTASVVTAQDESKVMQWLEEHAEDVGKASPEQLLKAIQRDLGEDVASEAAELLKEAAAKNEETTGHQGEKGEGPEQCKEWCESHYDRPCNCEEDKPDDRYDKYYANSKQPAWFTARKKSVYITGEASHSAEVWQLDGLHYVYLQASGETVQYIIKVGDEKQAVSYADEWVAKGSVHPKRHQSFVVKASVEKTAEVTPDTEVWVTHIGWKDEEGEFQPWFVTIVALEKDDAHEIMIETADHAVQENMWEYVDELGEEEAYERTRKDLNIQFLRTEPLSEVADVSQMEEALAALESHGEWVAEFMPERSAAVEAQHRRRPPRPRPLPKGPVRVKSPPSRPKAPPRDDEEMEMLDDEPRRPPKPRSLPKGPVRVKSPPSRPRMPSRAEVTAMLTVDDFKMPELVRVVEQLLDSGEYLVEEEHATTTVETLSPGAAGIHQPEEIAEYLDVSVPPEDVEYDDGWEFLEEILGSLADELTAKMNQMGLPGEVYFGHNEYDGAFEMFYAGDFEELQDIYGLKPEAAVEAQRRPPKPRPLPKGPVRVKSPPSRPKAPPRDEEEEEMEMLEEEPRRPPRPRPLPKGPVRVKSPPPRPRMPSRA
jgi:hypothetical protein